jgi:hypothetical protein
MQSQFGRRSRTGASWALAAWVQSETGRKRRSPASGPRTHTKTISATHNPLDTLHGLNLLVVHGHAEKGRRVPMLLPHVGIQQGLVAFAAAPEHVVQPWIGAAVWKESKANTTLRGGAGGLTTQLVRDFHGFLHLGAGVGVHRKLGVCARSAHVTRMGKQVCSAPQQVDARCLLMTRQNVGDLRGTSHAARQSHGSIHGTRPSPHFIKVSVGFSEISALWSDVTVVEGVVVDTQFGHELKRCACTPLGICHSEHTCRNLMMLFMK